MKNLSDVTPEDYRNLETLEISRKNKEATILSKPQRFRFNGCFMFFSMKNSKWPTHASEAATVTNLLTVTTN